MAFTPIESSIGGLLIAMSMISSLLFSGHIAGISGQLNTTVKEIAGTLTCCFHKQSHAHWGTLFVVGIILGGALLQTGIAPNALLPFPWLAPGVVPQNILFFDQPLFLFPLAGLLVGIGTKLASGCTSGHMIAGLARLSKRSFVATCTFCGVAFVTVKIASRAQHVQEAILGLPAQYETFVTIPPGWRIGALVGVTAAVAVIYGIALVIGLILFATSAAIVPATKYDVDEARTDDGANSAWNAKLIIWKITSLFLACFNGVVFSLGIGFAGMTNPVKVLGFFDIFGPLFDPSLACVVVFGIAPCLIAFQFIMCYAKREHAKPLLDAKFHLPTKTAITIPLLVGSALFGLGWGILGICPGPALSNVASLRPDVALYLLTFVIGNQFMQYVIDTQKINL